MRPQSSGRRERSGRGATPARPRRGESSPTSPRSPAWRAAACRPRRTRRGRACARPPRRARTRPRPSTTEHPYRERPHGPADARPVPLRPPGRRARRLPGTRAWRLADELGLEPSVTSCTHSNRAIPAHEPGRFCFASPSAEEPSTRRRDLLSPGASLGTLAPLLPLATHSRPPNPRAMSDLFVSAQVVGHDEDLLDATAALLAAPS